MGTAVIIAGSCGDREHCVWPESRAHLDKNLGGLPERVRRKITCENVARLSNLQEGLDGGGDRRPPPSLRTS